MYKIKAQVLSYRNGKHTCVPSACAVSTDPLQGPTLCKNNVVCYALPRSVKVEDCGAWLHACSVLWSEAEWGVFIKEWTRAACNATTWKVLVCKAQVAWFPVSKPGIGIVKDGSVGFVLPGRNTEQTTHELKFTSSAF